MMKTLNIKLLKPVLLLFFITSFLFVSCEDDESYEDDENIDNTTDVNLGLFKKKVVSKKVCL